MVASSGTYVPAPQPVVLDATVWISRTINTDSNYAAARAWITSHLRSRATLIVPALFEIEVGSAISRVTKDQRLARKEVAQLHRLNRRAILRFVPLSHSMVSDSTNLAINFGLRAADSVYVSIVLVTFDAELLGLPATVVRTIRP